MARKGPRKFADGIPSVKREKAALSAIVPAVSQRRNSGGARHEATERIILRRDGAEVEGWTLNLSRGGVRVVVEGTVVAGADYEVGIGELTKRPARIVWVREEADGQIVGLQFLDVEDGAVPGSVPPPASR